MKLYYLITHSNDFSGKIVFFNEGKNYWRVFYPVIEVFEKQKQEYIYVTADMNDPILQKDLKYAKCYELKNMQQAILFLNKIKADVVVMTTPQLNILTLKRSPHVRHYCHLLHAPMDIHSYKRFSFDYFDSILCSNSFQIKHLRDLEEKRGKSPKKLYETGCVYYDMEEISEPNRKNKKIKTILLAPTWGTKSFLTQNIIPFIEQLLKANMNIIFRPHPQSWISDKNILEKILSHFSQNKNFTCDKNVSGKESLVKSDMVICDISGIIYDSIFLHNKSVLVWNVDWKKGGYEYIDIDKTPSVLELVEKVSGTLLTEDNIDQILSIIESTPSKLEIKSKDLSQYLFNFQSAAPIAAQQILSIYQGDKSC